jgi:hypothetical protein
MSHRLKRFLVVALAGAALAIPAEVPAVATAKSCPHGFTHAVIGGEQKCLHAGEYCARSDERQYQHYHFECEKVHGTYRLEHS